MNVIRGNSHRGKSAITHIIDYCLGSSECNIPINVIRDFVSVFALVVRTEFSEIFVARENPEGFDSTSIMFLHEEDKINITPLTKDNKSLENLNNIKTDRKDVISRFNQIANFSNLSSIDNIEKTDTPSFRDTTAFQFQPQPIIANPTTLFYKTDSYARQNKLRTILPLLLGYKSNEMILLEKELELLERDLKEKENLWNIESKSFEAWKSTAYDHYLMAIDFGLTNKEVSIDDSKVEEIIYNLQSIVSQTNLGRLHIQGATVKFSEKYEELNDRRSEITSLLDELKFDLAKIVQIENSKNNYSDDVIKPKRERLKAIDWFIQQKGSESCPFCDSKSEKASSQLKSLQIEAHKNSKIENTLRSNEINLDQQIFDLRKQIGEQENSLTEIDKTINQLLNDNEKNKKSLDDVYKFIGRLEQIIININNTAPSGDLAHEIDVLRSNIEDKKGEINSLSLKFNKDETIKLLSQNISHYTKLLDIEDGDKNVVILDVESLNIKIKDNKRQNPYFLSRVGSGANHMGYHLATILGLHEFFLNLPSQDKTNFVPSFVVIDQPSQVYFPEMIPEDLNEESLESDEDFLNTRKIFVACSKFIERTKGKAQIIIVEHAPEMTWKGLNGIHEVEEWTGDDKEFNALIPQSWLSN